MKTGAFIDVDLQRLTYTRIRAKQNDSFGRAVNINVFANGNAFQVTDATEYVVQYLKPDGTRGFYTHLPDGSVAVTALGNTLYMTMAPQMLTAFGEVSCSIAMMDDQQQILQTFSFYIDVEESENAGATSDDYLNAPTLQNLINLTQVLQNKIGNISELKTSDKTSSVAAINELFTLLGSYQTSIGDSIGLLSKELRNRAKRVNGVTPNEAGEVFLLGEDIPAYPANIPGFEGSVDDALDELAAHLFDSSLESWRKMLENFGDVDLLGLPVIDPDAEEGYATMQIKKQESDDVTLPVPTVATVKNMIREAIRLGYIDVTKEYEEALKSGAVGSAREYLWTLGAGRWSLVVREDNGAEFEKFYLNAVPGEKTSVFPNGLVFRFLVHATDFFFVELHNASKYNAVPAIMLDGETGSIYSYGKEIGNGGSGTAGVGGYYLPVAKQTSEEEVTLSFLPRGDKTLPVVEDVTLTLPRGKNGYTPLKGVDYYTPIDKAEFEAYIATELAKRGQLKPEFANSVEECTDTSKLYVLPNGYIYAYMMTEVPEGGYTNLINIEDSNFKEGYRFNASNTEATTTVQGAFVSNHISANVHEILRIKGVKDGEGTSGTRPRFRIMAYDESGNLVVGLYMANEESANHFVLDRATISDDGVYTYELGLGKNADTSWDNMGIASIRISGIATDGIENIIVTVNEEMVEPVPVMRYDWVNTGKAFIPADYEEDIARLEAIAESLKASSEAIRSGARWYALGDSITQGWTSAVDDSADYGYRQFLNTNVAERWVNIVAKKNGYELTNHGIGGTGYLRSTETTMNARQLADTLDFSQCDFVTLAYGVNDWKYAVNIGSMDDDIENGGSMVANMRYVIKKILADNPLCKIFVITPINCKSLGTYDTNWGINYSGSASNGLGLEDIFALQKAVCDYHGIELLDMTHSSIVNRENIRDLLADSVHPTVEGHKLMARELSAKINFK